MSQAILNHEKIIRYNGIPSHYTKDVKDKQCKMCWDPNTYAVNSCLYCDSNEKLVRIKRASKKCARRSPSTTRTNRGKSGRLGKRKTKNLHFKRKRKEE